MIARSPSASPAFRLLPIGPLLAILLAASLLAPSSFAVTPQKKKHAMSSSSTRSHKHLQAVRDLAHGVHAGAAKLHLAPKPRASARRSAVAARSRHPLSARARFQRRHLVHVDPVSRLDAVSTIATTLSRGSSALSYPSALSSFYAALATHQEDPTLATVRVLQFGDSHTAADMFTGEARRVLQRQFGNGSVGFSYAGHPFAGYRILGSQRTQSGGWQTLGTHFSDLGDTMLGLGGVAIRTSRSGEYVTLDAPCTTLDLLYLQQPGGGTLRLSDNGSVIAEIPTENPTDAPGNFHYSCRDEDAELDHHFVVTTEPAASGVAGPVRIFGLTALQPGVTWESIGINGAEAPLILKWDQAIFANYLHTTAASLVVLAYGTNEAAVHWDPENYTDVFTRLIDKIHATLPGAAILVLGPADRATALRRRAYTPYSGTDRILDIQRDVCRTHHCAFWDEQQRMGGFGSMGRWVYAGWAQPDHTHLTGEGYRALADALLADLLSGYDSYRKAHGLAITPVSSTASASAPDRAGIPPTPASARSAPATLRKEP